MKRKLYTALALLLICFGKLLANPPKDTTQLLLYHKYFNDSFTAATNQSLYQQVFKWLGTPYRYGGSSSRGIDCSSFIKKLYQNTYNINLVGGSANIFTQVNRIEKDSLREGDLLFFKTRGNRISHIGIYLKDNKFAHAAMKRGIVIDDLNDLYYRKKFFSAGRHNAVEKHDLSFILKNITPIEPKHFVEIPCRIKVKLKD